LHQIDDHSDAVLQSLHLEVKKITLAFLRHTGSKLSEVLEGVHNEVLQELENCRGRLQKLKKSYASLMELGKRVESQCEGQEEGHDNKNERKKKKAMKDKEEGHEGQQESAMQNRI
jgi:Mg2+ and Co2+ transporter CorA